MTSAIDRHLSAVRCDISVIDVARAAELRRRGAVFVDIRPVAQRGEAGGIPGALLIERNVLEWRLDPTSPDRHDALSGHTGPLVIFCQEGYASSLAVGTLGALGIQDVHDLAGGFAAWSSAGLPVEGADR